MIRIPHAADPHLDSPFEGLPAEKTAIRRREQRELLRGLAQLRDLLDPLTPPGFEETRT